jgi:hemolysin-activating ACP:hemolysin acyltransferase
MHDPKVLLHDSEWIEGTRLWIMDFVARKGAARAILKQIRETMFLSFTEARSLRRRLDGTVRCINIWRRRINPNQEVEVALSTRNRSH